MYSLISENDAGPEYLCLFLGDELFQVGRETESTVEWKPLNPSHYVRRVGRKRQEKAAYVSIIGGNDPAY